MMKWPLRHFAHAAWLASMLATGLAWLVSVAPAAAAPVAQRDFASAEDAAVAMVDAVRSGEQQSMLAVLGPAAQKLTSSGDPIADQNARKKFLDDYEAKHSMESSDEGRAVLVVGNDDWPLPIPIVQSGGRWHFDSAAGSQELINRRIGRNELLTIRTLLAAVDAQEDYFERDKAGTGTGTYAERILSTPGHTDGLYWPVSKGQPPSPLGPLVDQAQSEGYPGAANRSGKQLPYHGYFFRMLKSQGPDAPGGARDYLHDGRLTGGFAILAWPAIYGSSGIVTFQVNQDGIVFQKDLGPNTARLAAAWMRFDPDLTWARVDISD
jgi:hypothetical protein